MSLAITPGTTIGELLAAYPEIEAVLIGMAPAFAKLRNPVVRRTVAKVATIEQVSKIGGVSLQQMIFKLREATGQQNLDDPAPETVLPGEDRPSGVNDTRVVEEIDADTMLERGVHPIGRVREIVAKLKPGESVILRSSFRPEPLIETMRRAGANVRTSTSGGRHLTWFGKLDH